MKKIFYLLLLLICLMSTVIAQAETFVKTLKIHGSVAHELTLTRSNLENYQQATVHLNEVLIDGRFRGVFELRGVPLKALLESAVIQKTDTDFNKPVDLVVMLRSSSGQYVTLSWGEIFYRNPGDIIIATSGVPIIPHKGIHHFSDPDEYRTMIKVLHREIDYPKLVIGSDFYADRALEDIADIEIIDLKANIPGEKSSKVRSDWFRVNGKVSKELLVHDLSIFSRQEITTHIVGEGRGYHGSHHFEGAPFKEVLLKAEPSINMNTVFLVSAPDAYRSAVSYGELFLKQPDDRTIIADLKNGTAIENGGRFILVIPDDVMADREVQAICRIEVFDMDIWLKYREKIESWSKK
ncbi:MAG: hypothetical protein K9L30_07840 [Desulfobacterales bacterium]|nr:hypothetical protein [Desulfobacterales bacterium]